jgi:chemotaxis protein methyltransferase CheR
MSTADPLNSLREIVERESGIQIGDQKLDLLKNRIRKRLRATNSKDEKEYLQILEADVEGNELVHLLDVISTNHTFFWREHEHFPIYKKILSELDSNTNREIKTWCAASSSGEEPYTLAIINDQVFGNQRGKILATDISTRILHKAFVGNYQDESIAKLPPEFQKYFNNTDEKGWKEANQTIKSKVTYKKLNLAKFPYPLNGKIDVIFCRNVMIYFDTEHKQKIIDEFQRLLNPGGYVFISHSENLLGIKHNLKSIAVGVYKKDGNLW